MYSGQDRTLYIETIATYATCVSDFLSEIFVVSFLKNISFTNMYPDAITTPKNTKAIKITALLVFDFVLGLLRVQ